jgi:leader peptidase (prepilin peptidase) / N-methyltransferase
VFYPDALPLSAFPPQTAALLGTFAFFFGCCVGSYLNVVIYRVPLGLKTHEPSRSFCPKCKYLIPFWHNIPIVSWLLLRGKCRNCQSPISIRYLGVELLTGLLFAAAFYHLGWHPMVLAIWVFLSLCVAGSFIDIDHQILPHRITWGGAAVGLAASWLVPNMIVEAPRLPNFLHSLGGAAVGYAVIWLIIRLGKLMFGKLKLAFDAPTDWRIHQPEESPEPIFAVGDDSIGWSDLFFRKSDRLEIHASTLAIDDASFGPGLLTLSEESVSFAAASGEAFTKKLDDVKAMSGQTTLVVQPREAMGYGDANWLACTGAFLGWKGALFSIFAGSIIGALIAGLMILCRRREFAQRIPFGPYLALGGIAWIFFGPRLLDWYLNLGRQWGS